MLQDKSPPKPQKVNNFTGSPSRFNRKYVARQPSVRQCTLFQAVSAAEMPSPINSKAEIKYKKEVELVSEKVMKTRHEIEELKAQLQLLINEGISKTNFTQTKQNLSVQDNTDKIHEIKAKTFKDNVADTFKTDVVVKKLTPSILKSADIKELDREESVKKVRHYDQEVARKYIQKQKKRRKEELNKHKKEAISADLRKQRLQQLREKSLRLLTKNIEHNRARSKEPAQKAETLKCNSAVSLNVSKEIPHPQLQNITIRSQQTSNDQSPRLFTKLHEKSALKIQAAFRGYRQRKIYKELRKKKQGNVSKEVQTHHFDVDIPAVRPYPYNFINAVKRKLNLATQQQPKACTVDAAIQSSLIDKLISPSVDLKSFLSHKCLELEPLTLFSNKKSNSNQTLNVENGCASESDTSKNIPELSSECSLSESLQKKSAPSTKRTYSSDSDQKFTISLEPIKKLKLKQSKSIDSEISEHLNEGAELSPSRDSVIASNKSNYVTKTNSQNKSLTEELKTVSVVSTKREVSSSRHQITNGKEQNVDDVFTYNFDNKENISQVTGAQNRSNSYSSNFTNVTADIPKLEPPKVSLKTTTLPVTSGEGSDEESTKRLIGNVTLRPGEKTTLQSKAKTNEIHLKFEAELHLLNDFNESLRRVMAVEKSLLELHDKKNEAASNYATRDTQTSLNQQHQVAHINYSRGSDITEALSIDKDLSLVTTGLDLSPFNSPIEESNSEVSFVNEKVKSTNVLSGISLEMFEQLIRDEDARIENLKTILKIREKSLVDRTKGELAWLEIQKKHLRDAGQLQEISAIKKKQRGLLIKLEHERHEMQRLKQMQKAASKERKSVLKEQRNMIKAQLAAGNTVTRIKRHTREEKRQSGPFKVYNITSHNDSIMSETSVTRKSSITEEVISATSNHSHSIVSHVSEELVLSEKFHVRGVRTENVKRSLLMREAALQKRKKVAEELLQWHQRLLEEERKITELELAASAIINQVPIAKGADESMNSKQKFKGSQLNQLWLSLTGCSEKKFKDDEIYNMSQASLEKFCRNAKKYERTAANHKKTRKPVKCKNAIPIEDVESEYLSDFESVVTSASSVSDHCQTNGDSTLSNQEDETVTEIIKPKKEETESDVRHVTLSNNNVVEEHKQDASSKITVTEILSEIDKYLESQSNNKSIVRGDDTTVSKSISKDDSESNVVEQICDKTQVVEFVEDRENAETAEIEDENSFCDIPAESLSNSNLVVNIDSEPKVIITENGCEVETKSESTKTINETASSINELSAITEKETTSKKYTEGISCIDGLYNNDSEDLSKPKDEVSFVSLLEESNKNSAEPTTTATVSEPTTTTTKEPNFKISEDLVKSEIFYELPHSTITSEKDEKQPCSNNIKSQTLEVPELEKINSTVSCVTEISEDEVSLKMATEDAEGVKPEKSIKQDDKSGATIDSITEIEEDEASFEESEVEKSISEEHTTENEEESSKTEPRLLLSYGYVEENSVKDEEKEKTDVKKRVSEILADANISSPRGDKSPRLQDFYVTAYDVVSPNNTPEATSPPEAQQPFTPPNVFGSDEVEELFKKQLEIEQEIKAIQQQQQKEQLPYLYVREIPNKPPPPYTPPVNAQSSIKGSILPSGDNEIDVITNASAQILYKAALNNNIKEVTLTDNAKRCLEFKSNVEGPCYDFIFDLSKEFAVEHYKQFEPETGPFWTHLQKRTKLALGKPFDQTSLQKYINEKVKQVLGQEVVKINENFKHKWSGKKRDHVDDLLVIECQAEEAEWTNYDRDELIVKDELTKEIMNMLLSETGQVLNNVLSKKKYLC